MFIVAGICAVIVGTLGALLILTDDLEPGERSALEVALVIVFVVGGIFAVFGLMSRDQDRDDRFGELERNTALRYPEVHINSFTAVDHGNGLEGTANVEKDGCTYFVDVTEVKAGLVLVNGSERPTDNSIVTTNVDARTGSAKCPSSPFDHN